MLTKVLGGSMRPLLSPVKPQHFWWRGFRRKAVNSKPGGKGGSSAESPLLLESFDLPPPRLWSLARPAAFALGVTAASMTGAAIWQYENMRKEATNVWKQQRDRLQRQMQGLRDSPVFKGFPGSGEGPEIGDRARKAGEWRQEANRMWNGLTPGQRVFAPILAANLAVWALWKVPKLRPTMLKWFACNPAAKARCIPMLTSAFSHYSFFHLAANMYVLHSFSSPMVAVLGKEQFVGVYASSAVISSFFSSLYKVVTGRCGYSLGASGAILTIIGVFGSVMPEAKLQIIFLPMLSFTASTALKGLMAMDTAGMVAGWKFFDHAAHLSGLLFGIWWVHQGNELVWNRREIVMRWWHENVRKESGKPPPPD